MTFTHMHTHKRTCTHAHMHACTCTHACTHARAHTHTHTHTHTQPCSHSPLYPGPSNIFNAFSHRKCFMLSLCAWETLKNWMVFNNLLFIYHRIQTCAKSYTHSLFIPSESENVKSAPFHPSCDESATFTGVSASYSDLHRLLVAS